MFNDYFKHVGFIRLKLFIFKGVVWNSLLVMFLCENNSHARFIRLFYFFLSVYGTFLIMLLLNENVQFH